MNKQTSTIYWSSSSGVSNPTTAWSLRLSDGNASRTNKSGGGHVWPVRGGHCTTKP